MQNISQDEAPDKKVDLALKRELGTAPPEPAAVANEYIDEVVEQRVNDAQVLLDALPEMPSTQVAYQLLIWLKYWTKAHGINDPKKGSLGSFGWRCILLAVLGELGVVPCLRAGSGKKSLQCKTACVQGHF